MSQTYNFNHILEKKKASLNYIPLITSRFMKEHLTLV